MRITFVRHGETTANVAKRWQGQSNAPLSTRGLEQVAALARRVSELRPTLVVSSNLGRAEQTARALFWEIELDPAWREADVGRWEGLTQAEVAEQYPDEVAALALGQDVKLGGGESRSELDARVAHALETLEKRLGDEDHAVVVAHGGVIWSVVGQVLGYARRRRRPVGRVTNTSLTTIEVRGHRRAVAVYNDAFHLGERASVEASRDHDGQRVIRFIASPDEASEPQMVHGAAEVFRVAAAHAQAEAARVVGSEIAAFARLVSGNALHAITDEKRVILVDYNVAISSAPPLR